MKLAFMFLTHTNSFDVNHSVHADHLASLGVGVTVYFYKRAPAGLRHARVKVFGSPFRLFCLLDMIFWRADLFMGLQVQPRFQKLAQWFGIQRLIPKFLPDVTDPQFVALYHEKPYKFTTRFKDFHAEYDSWEQVNDDKGVWIFSPTEKIRDYYVSLGFDRAKSFIIPHGVLTDVFRPEPQAHEGFNLLFIGADAVRKGLSYALKAFERVRTDYPETKLTIVGRFVVCKEPGVETIDEALNPAYLTHVPKYFNRADLVVFPSLVDGQPIVVLEALACGVPVLTTHDIGFDDIIKDGYNGFLVDKRDDKAIEEKMRWCLSHPAELKKMRANARKTALEHTWMDSAKKFKEQLDALDCSKLKA